MPFVLSGETRVIFPVNVTVHAECLVGFLNGFLGGPPLSMHSFHRSLEASLPIVSVPASSDGRSWVDRYSSVGAANIALSLCK